MNFRHIAEQIFLAGVERVLPARLIEKELSVSDNCLRIREVKFPLDSIKNIYVIGAGKASALMAAEVERILDTRISGGAVVVKYGHACSLKHIDVYEAGHPVPDDNGFNATRKVLEIARKATADDLVISLISGGGSALLADYPDGSVPGDIILLNDLLVNCGATIKEINTVRKHLSKVKGGQLASAVYPATLVNLLLSDVPGDHPDVIASGPASPDPTTFQMAIEVLEKYGLAEKVPVLFKYLEEGLKGLHPETPKPYDKIFERTFNIITGNNKLALEAAAAKAIFYNLNTIVFPDQVEGDTNIVSAYLVEMAKSIQADPAVSKPVCLLFGGETTVRMSGKGFGGRNQHLALLASGLLQNQPGITFLAAGTDGNDGPTDAAGAVVDSETFNISQRLVPDPQEFLRNFDSYNFFRSAGGHIITGPTGTNVMDIIVVIIS